MLPPLIQKLREQRGLNASALKELKAKKAEYSPQRQKIYDLLGDGPLELGPELTKKQTYLKD